MNETAHGVRGNKSQEPENDQNDGKGFKHAWNKFSVAEFFGVDFIAGFARALWSGVPATGLYARSRLGLNPGAARPDITGAAILTGVGRFLSKVHLRRFVAAMAGHFGQLLVRGFFLVEDILEEFRCRVVAELIGPFAQTTV